MYLIGEFREKDALVAAIKSLKASGISTTDLDLFSEEPVEFPRGVLDRPSSMSLVSVGGAVTCGGLATAGVYLSQNNYKLITGGMPVFSMWGTGVITYETTMLGAIVATFAWFLWESGLLRKRDRSAPLPEVAPGSMCLRVRCSAPEAGRTSEILNRSGAIDIEHIDIEKGGDAS
jgi:hypothetical protein